MATYYTWSDLYIGGETEMKKTHAGRDFKVIAKRTVVPRGEKVSKSKVGLSDEEWDECLANGSIRPYPLPKGADEYTSPANAMTAAIVNDKGEVDMNKVMELGLTVPPVASDEEESDVPVGA